MNSADIVYETRPRVPKFIGSYLLGDVLGEGSYARVSLFSLFPVYPLETSVD